MMHPSTFISYSHDSEAHKDWVLRLASDLRERGVDAILDRWDLVPGQDISSFMQRGILDSDRVLIICSDKYVEKAESGSGGVGFERLIVTSQVVENIDTKKFIPLVRGNAGPHFVPRFLGPRLYLDFRMDNEYDSKLDELVRALCEFPRLVKPPLGQNPFSAELPPATGTPRLVGPTGIASSGQPFLSGPWFEEQEGIATSGLSALDLRGCMELRFGLHVEVVKSQLDLLNAVRKSQVHTFGWPIAVTLENQSELKPRPYGDGIRAEIPIKSDIISGRQSYDYWALRRSGDFYLLQSLFEDSRDEQKIFFNTRIIRVTEALMFASNLYANLGVQQQAQISVRVSHRDLAGRWLTGVGNRHIIPTVSHEAVCESEIVTVLGSMGETLVDDVRRLIEPMFMLFEFQEFAPSVYEDIVRRYEKGEAS